MIVTYQVDDSTEVKFEVEPLEGFMPAGGPDQVVGQVKKAVAPAVDAAKVVLDQIKKVRPDEVEVTFGIKVSGRADWIVAKAAAEASFEIRLLWKRPEGPADADPANTGPATADASSGSAPTAAT